jgi:hypothetical protein
MATRYKEQHLVAGIALLLAGIACANPLPQRQVVALATASPAMPTPAETATACQYVVTAETLNVRKCAGTWCAGIGILEKGQRVDVVRLTGAWAELDSGGFVNETYLKQECK